MIDRKSSIDVFEDTGKKPERLEGEIEFVDVCFSYPQRPEAKVLRNLNMKIQAKKTVAIVGSRYKYQI